MPTISKGVMNTGETQRLPANLQILTAALVFTLISYVVFRGLWQIKVPVLYLLPVFALQIIIVLVGNRGVFTSMGASSIAVIFAVATYFAAVFLLFPADRLTFIAGIAGGAVSAIFVLTSAVTSFRAGTLDMEILDDLQIYTREGEELPGTGKEADPDRYFLEIVEENGTERVGEEVFLGEPIDLTEGVDSFQPPGETVNGGLGKHDEKSTVGSSVPAGKPDSFPFRSRYRVIEAATGNPVGIFYSDEGYSSIDLETLGVLAGEKIGPGEPRIVNLDWSNFDEVEVQVEIDPIPGDFQSGLDAAGEDPGGHEILHPDDGAPSMESGNGNPVLPEGVIETEHPLEGNRDTTRYVIYERRTMRPLGEYVPEGGRPRIDRLTLYRMLPEYDFRTFQIDSIRWFGAEVGIFIKGEKKSK